MVTRDSIWENLISCEDQSTWSQERGTLTILTVDHKNDCELYHFWTHSRTVRTGLKRSCGNRQNDWTIIPI